MELEVARRLIENGISHLPGEQLWADLGAGKGLFSRALAGLLDARSMIFAVDKDGSELQYADLTPAVSIWKIRKDFVRDDLGLHPLDGVLMANSLHFVKDKKGFLTKLTGMLKPSGRIVVVEYDMDSSNLWVPYPISFNSLREIALDGGFARVTKIGEEPSDYNKAGMYGALLERN